MPQNPLGNHTSSKCSCICSSCTQHVMCYWNVIDVYERPCMIFYTITKQLITKCGSCGSWCYRCLNFMICQSFIPHTVLCKIRSSRKVVFFICDNFYCYSPLYEYLCSGFTVLRKNRKNLACKSKSFKVRKLRKRSYRLGKSQEKIPFF